MYCMTNNMGSILQKLQRNSLLLTTFIVLTIHLLPAIGAKEYYYTRTRSNPNHLRVSEDFKNKYVDEIKYESKINGTKYEYYKSSLSMSHDELVFETIDKIFRHRLSAFYIHHYDNEDDKQNAADPKLVSKNACARDLMYLVDKLPKRYNSREPYTNKDEDHLSPELTAFFDSYARQEPGLLMGNTYWVGAYDQCVNRDIFEITGSQHPSLARKESDQQVVSFKGRYCVSSLKSPTWDSIIENKKQKAKNYFKTERQINDYAKLFRLQVGICLPSSCDSTSLAQHAEEIKHLTTSMLEQRYADYELIDLYCLPDETSPLRAWSGSALLFLAFIGTWFFLVVTATSCDLCRPASEKPPTTDAAVKRTRSQRRFDNFVNWFSLRANYRKLMKVNEEHQKEKDTTRQEHARSAETTERASSNEPASAAGPYVQENPVLVNLRFLNAFKVLIMFWIINGHIMLLMIQTAKNILYSDALLNELMHFLIGATFGVDLFFTMTGFITAYLIFNSGHAYKMKPLTWLTLFFHRYWRLAPMYLLSFWFSRSVMQLLGSGPLWDYGTTSITFRGLCNHESWWYPMTLTSNLHGLFEECMITSWYISCDMQFWLLSPIFIYLLAKNPMHGWVASLCTIFMSSKVRFDSILTDQSARYDELIKPRADIFMRVSHDLPALYTHPHHRISAYIVGMLAGHFVYMVKSRKWKSNILTPAQQEPTGAALCKCVDSVCQCAASDTIPDVAKPDASELLKPGKLIQRKEKLSGSSRTRSFIAYTGLAFFLIMAFVSYLLSHHFPAAWLKHAKLAAAIAYSVDHLIMSVAASMVIVAMCFGEWSTIVNFLSHPVWTRLSKINYALLLLQCEGIYFQIFRYDQVPVAGTRELINILFNLLVTLYPVAFVVTLVFEFPLANIEKLLI